MSEIKYNQIVLAVEEFGEELWNEVGETLRILTTAGYECQVYDDDCEIIVIRFNYSPDRCYGNHTLEWVSDDDKELLNSLKNDECDTNAEVLEDLEEVSF